jgi:hypothetical protein
MNRKLIVTLALAALGAQAGIARADNNEVFAEAYWKANLISISGRKSIDGTQFVSAPAAPSSLYSFLSDYNP